MIISHLFDDPTVRALLEAAERDQGEASTIPAGEPRAPLTGAAEAAAHPRRIFLAAGPARAVFADLRAAADAKRELEAA